MCFSGNRKSINNLRESSNFNDIGRLGFRLQDYEQLEFRP